ncbi:MAG TPA: cellulase family glycosylhydrolase [Fimbriimonas sp.]|nr:cellulase family glycosylhydrolase [Fimbriimonas sp.]
MLLAVALQAVLLASSRLPVDGLRVPDGLAINAHIQDFAPGEADKMADAGFQIVRTNLMWYETEEHKGVFDFKRGDSIAIPAAAAGMRPMFILYGNREDPFPSPSTPEEIAGFAKFAGEAARHYARYRPIWELWNEPDSKTFWKPSPDPRTFAKLAVATAKAIREADPSALIIGPALTEIKYDYLKSVFDSGLLSYIDDVSIHMYREASPENALGAYRLLSTFIQGYHPTHRIGIMCTEWGYPLTLPGISQTRQAEYDVRMYLIGMMAGLDSTAVYEWNDDTPGQGNGDWGHFALHNEDRSIRPGLTALKNLVHDLDGYRLTSYRADGPVGEYLMVFKNGAHTKVVGWTPAGDPQTEDQYFKNPTGNLHATVDADYHGTTVHLTGMPKVVLVD